MTFTSEFNNDINREISCLNDDSPTTVPFPIKVFPVEVQEIIRSANEGLNYPIDFFSSSILFACSIAIGNTFQVEIKQGWTENATIWVALVGNSGTNKSHPLSTALEPIFHRQSEEFRKYEAELKIYNEWIQLSKEDKEDYIEPIPLKPILKKFILSDFTPEALIYHHQNNLRGMAVYVDELAGWFNNFNRYNKGSEEQFWLTAWSGKVLIADRRSSGSFHVKHPFIPVGGTIQSSLLKELSKGTKGKNGFIERVLFSFPDNLIKFPWSDSCWQTNHRNTYSKLIDDLLLQEPRINEVGDIVPINLTLTNSAKTLLWNWQKVITEYSNSTDNDQKKAIYAKIEIYAIRLSLILHRINCAFSRKNEFEIDAQAVTGGIELAEYFRKTALKVLHVISNTSPIDLLTKDKRGLYDLLPDRFDHQIASKLAETRNISGATLRRMLADRQLFDKIRHNDYSKIY